MSSLHVAANFRVVDETGDWIVVDKPAPLIVHPANRNNEPTLLGGLERLLAFEVENGSSLGIVNRLDRDTSGLVLVAKHAAAARELGMIFERRAAKKQYLAIVHGWPEQDAWECREPLVRASEVGRSEIWVRQTVSAIGRESTTDFRVERRFERPEGRFSLVRCFPFTGRMHQIRVHLAHASLPIVGDKIYSGNGREYLDWLAGGLTPALLSRLLLPRHALHAAVLQIPWQGRAIQWESELPHDLADWIDGREAAFVKDVFEWNNSGSQIAQDRASKRRNRLNDDW